MKKLLLFAFAACALAACSDDDGDSRVPATAVVLDCTEKELAVGETLQLTATPAPANTTDDVVWSSDAEEFATVSESGLVTAVAAGTAKISATYGSVSATCTVHVSEPDPEPDPDPNPDPEPEPEIIEVIGAPYTYCFEDGWPWIGDYDMNDVVVVTGIDRLVNKESGKVGSIRINWELKAAGAAHLNAFAVQLDKVAASQVASVETTNTAFGKGAFAGPGLESGNEYAVIPLFNTAQEILGEGTYINTSKGTAPVPTVKHTTTVTFTRPVDAAAVLESAVNAFIVVNSKSSGVFSRDTEVHMPTYKPTGFAVVSGNTFAEAEPYKYFVSKGTGMKDNYMMLSLIHI